MADPSMADQKLIEENALLTQRILDLEQSDAARKRAEEALRERVKELSCLHRVADVIEKEDSLEKILQSCAGLMPDAWLYPEIACARIVFGGRQYQTATFRESAWRQSADLKVDGQTVGLIELCYLEERPIRDEGPFLREERNLINAISERIGRVVERKRAEETRRDSEERFRGIVDNSQAGYFFIDLDGCFQSVNDAWLRMHDYESADEVLGQHFSLTQVGTDTETAQRNVEQVLAGASIQAGEFSRRCRDGSVRFHTSSAGAVIQKGKVVGLEGFLIDITERKRAEEALRNSKALLSNSFNNSPLLMTITDLSTGMFLEVNDSFCRTSGFSREEAIGKTTAELGWLGVEGRTRLLHELQQHGKVAGLELALRSNDGKPVTCRYWGDVVQTAQGDRLFSAAEDITEPKRAEEALRESEERFREVFEKGPLGMVMADVSEGRFTAANAVFCEMLGYTAEELKRLSFADVTHPDHRSRDVEAVKRLWEGQIPLYKTEKRYVKKNGETLMGSLTASVIRSTDGKPLYSLAMIDDITERKRAEEEKLILEAELQQAQKMESVGRLAGGVAHDFNNMLGVILGHAELALGQLAPTQPLHASLKEIHKAATRSADLTRQLLAFARKQTIAPKVLDLNDTVEGMLKMLRRVIGEDIRLAWLPGKGVWPVRVDPSQIDQILANLCVNARDAISGVGNLTIETGTIAFDAAYCAGHAGFLPGEYVRLAVSDDGCGMDTDTQSHIFEPFFTTKGVGKGTGLGLATVYGIVKQNNGFINVLSELGHGTTITIYLQPHVGKAKPARTDGAVQPAQRGHETILLVEDEPAILSLTTTMLERQGYTVLAALTPGEAIRLAREHTGEIHLLMTDVIMPEMNGRDLARNLLSLYPHLGRLFMSGYTADVIANHGVLDDGVCFIQKPFSINDLAAKVREALDRE